MKVELKLCPFCGCSAGLYKSYDGCYAVQCNVCGNRTLCQRDKDDAIKLWNRRRNENHGQTESS